MRAVLAALAALAIVLCCSGVASAAPIQWTECGTTFKGECATIKVPVDYKQPAGAKFDLAIGRVKALDPAHKIGVLFINPGGPGNSGISAYIIGRSIPDDSALRKYFDIISLDPRGVSRSHAVHLQRGPRRADADRLSRRPRPSTARCLASTPASTRTASRPPARWWTTSTRSARSATSTPSARRWARRRSPSTAPRTARRSASSTPSCSRSGSARWRWTPTWTTASPTRSRTCDDDRRPGGSFLEFAAWCRRTASCALHGRDVVALWDDLFRKAESGTLIDPATGMPLDAESLRLELFIGMFRTVELARTRPAARRVRRPGAATVRPDGRPPRPRRTPTRRSGARTGAGRSRASTSSTATGSGSLSARRTSRCPRSGAT